MNEEVAIGLMIFLILIGMGGCSCLIDLGSAGLERAKAECKCCKESKKSH